MDVFKCLESHINDCFKLKLQNLLLKLINFFLSRSKDRKSVGSSNHVIDKSMQLDRSSQALLV